MLRDHLEWIGYVQPTRLLVSAPALAGCGAFVNRNIVPEHKRFIDALTLLEIDGSHLPGIADLPRFLQEVLGWRASDIAGGPGGPKLPDDLEVALPEYGETLRPAFAVPAVNGGTGAGIQAKSGGAAAAGTTDRVPAYQLLIMQTATATDLDSPLDADNDRRWQASPQARLERLLRETQVPIGLLSNGTSLRLVYAPRGESSGYATFHIEDMSEVAGRPIFAALYMLLSAERPFTLPDRQRLPAILLESRKYQNLVSTRVAQQVLAALMVRNDEGLTKTYNRFHDPEETSPDIMKLRELHAAMDHAVLDAYGWTDLQPTCAFLLDYEDDEPDDDDTPTRAKNKPWRYRWPDPLRNEVLDCLLALNQQRASSEPMANGPVLRELRRPNPTRGRRKGGIDHPEGLPFERP
jgi:hypothetical protein